MSEMGNVMDSENKDQKSPGTTRVWCDGCYDMTHFGHANSLRQAKLLGQELYVGVHSDEQIKKHKDCYPVLKEQERYTMVRAYKWVDHVVENAPYMTTVETLDEYDCDFCAHGDDTSTNAEGMDTYQKVKDAGRYEVYGRTRGVSTTGLINRVLNARDRHHCNNHSHISNGSAGDRMCDCECKIEADDGGDKSLVGASKTPQSSYTGNSSPFIISANVIHFFAEGAKMPKEVDKIVYAPGSFDLTHPGHLSFLEEAAKAGDYLVVGLYSDETIKKYKGYYPITNLMERFFSLMALKCVSDVYINVPYVITEKFIADQNIHVVAHGNRCQYPENGCSEDPFSEIRENGVVREIKSNCELTTKEVIQRITNNRKVFKERNAKKEKKESEIINESKEVNNVNEEKLLRESAL